MKVLLFSVVVGALSIECGFSQAVPLLDGFIENQGQWPDKPFSFIGSIGDYSVGVEDRGWVLSILDTKSTASADARSRKIRSFGDPEESRKCWGLRMRFMGPTAIPEIEPDGLLPGPRNFFIGNDSSQWKTNVSAWQSVRFIGMYPGVDVRIRHNGRGLEYDLFLEPGVDLDQVEVMVEGALALQLSADGALMINTGLGPIFQPSPKTWEVHQDGEVRPVHCRYDLRGKDRFGFNVETRRPDLALVVDPELVFSTYLGGSGWHYMTAPLHVNSSQCVFIAGETNSMSFPVTPGSFQLVKSAGDCDSFVACLDPSGSSLRFATYLGGSGEEWSSDLHADDHGVVTVLGRTVSGDFPVTPGAYMSSGPAEVFLAQLNPTGSKLIFSTRFGSDATIPVSLAAAPDGGWVMGGDTSSRSFPITPGVFDPIPPLTWIDSKVFIAKLDGSGSNLLFSTFYGAASGWTCTFLRRLRVTPDGHIVFIGRGSPVDLIVTKDSLWPDWIQTYPSPWPDPTVSVGFLGVADSDCRSLTYSTIIGQRGSNGYWLGVPSDVYVLEGVYGECIIGATVYGNFPIPSGAFDQFGFFHQSLLSYPQSGVVVRFNWQTNSILAASYVAGYVAGVGVDSVKNIVGVCISGSMQDPFLTPHALNPCYPRHPRFPELPGGFQMWLGKFDFGLSLLSYSTYLGGATYNNEVSTGLSLLGEDALVAGHTEAYDYPVTPNAFDRKPPSYEPPPGPYHGLRKAFITRLPLESPGVKRLGKATFNCLGAPTIYVRRDPKAGEPNFGFECWKAPPSSVGFLMIGTKVLDRPFDALGAAIWIDPTQTLLCLAAASDEKGKSVIHLPLPVGTAGASFSGQFVWLNTATCPGSGILSASDALGVVVQ